MGDRIDPGSIRIAPLTRAHAEDLATWHYDPPYDVYDLTGADPDELLHPALGFHAVLAGERLIGFRSFGPDGQVPGWDYDDAALDAWAAKVRGWAEAGLDVYVYCDNDAKVRAPFDAMGLLDRLDSPSLSHWGE